MVLAWNPVCTPHNRDKTGQMEFLIDEARIPFVRRWMSKLTRITRINYSGRRELAVGQLTKLKKH